MPVPIRARSISPIRVVAVTGGLAIAGAVVGAGLGAAVVGVWGLVVAGPRALWENPQSYGFAAMVGAVVGLVLAPPVAWLLLRRVPLGRAILETAAGTALGATAGLLLSGFHPYYGLAGACGGLVLAAVRLSLLVRRATRV